MITDTDIMSLRVLLPTGPEVMHPAGLHKLKRRHTRKNKWQISIQVVVSGEITFRGEDFWKLYALECSNVREGVIEAEVLRAGEGITSMVGKLVFTLNEAKWNLDDCAVLVKVREAGTVGSKAHFDKTYNLFEIMQPYLHSKTSQIQPASPVDIHNGMWFSDAFLWIGYQEGLSGVTSSLLQWNTNKPRFFPGTSNWDRLVLHQLSDAVRAGMANLNPATKLETSLDDLLNDVCLLFNARWDVDTNGYLVIEHVTYWQGTNGTDLTIGENGLRNERSARWEYEKLDLPPREVFLMPNATPAFSGWPLEYAVPSALVKNLKEEQESHEFKLITTDLRFVNKMRLDALLSGSLPDSGSMTGALLLAVDANGHVLNDTVYSPEISPGTYDTEWNGPVAMSYTMPICWKDDRPFRQGFINDSVVTLQKRRTRRQVGVKMQRCFASGDDELVLDKRVKTALGWGDVVEAEEDLRSGLVDMSVLHEDLPVTNTIPMTQAADITYIQGVGDPIDFTDYILQQQYNWPLLANLLPGEYIRPFERFGGLLKVFRNGMFYLDTPGFAGQQNGQLVPFVYDFQFTIVNALGFTSSATATIDAQ